MRKKTSMFHRHDDERGVFEMGPNLGSSNIQALRELLLTLRCHMDAEVNLVDCFMMKSCPDMPRITRVELLTSLRK